MGVRALRGQKIGAGLGPVAAAPGAGDATLKSPASDSAASAASASGCGLPLTAGSPAAALESEAARALLQALADPLRLRVIDTLGSGERCVCELTELLGLAQSRLSFHLKVLKEAGLIDGRQQGRWIYYRLRPEAITALQAWLGALAASCTTPAPPCC